MNSKRVKPKESEMNELTLRPMRTERKMLLSNSALNFKKVKKGILQSFFF